MSGNDGRFPVRALLKSVLPIGFRSSLLAVIGKTRQALGHVGLAIWSLAATLWKRVLPLPLPVLPDNKVLLHLGCGSINHPDFINIDGLPYPHVHYVHRIDKLPMFGDACADLIYASHCLEHFRYSETGNVLKEWHRILKIGGVLRLSVPDFDRLLAIYRDNGNDPDWILPQLMGGQENRFNFHLTILNRVNLERLLNEAGFWKVREWTPGADRYSSFDDFSVYKKCVNDKWYEVSLNIQAEKVDV